VNRYRTPIKNARGLGSANHGTHHFFASRLSSLALVPLSLWFLYFIITLLQADYLTATDAIARPWNAMLLIAFLLFTFWHTQLGMQVVIEDYVHSPALALCSQIVIYFICVSGALASVFAVVRIALGGA
jgi:succinate dehydrogenase / fumarate reductase membrane anchor subunit